MHVAVLCGGKGTRLGEPIKCLTEVAGKPFMDWKLEQLERQGATDVTLYCGPHRSEYVGRYGRRVAYLDDRQEGIRGALGAWGGWWTMGDVLLEQPLEGEGVCYVTPGTQIAGLWLDAGLYHGQGPWIMVESEHRPWTINTPADLKGTDAYLRRHCLPV